MSAMMPGRSSVSTTISMGTRPLYRWPLGAGVSLRSAGPYPRPCNHLHLERDHSHQGALEAERRAQEAVALQVDPVVRAADEHRDRPAAGAQVELEGDEIADVDPVVLDDLTADLAAAEELRPQLVRVLAAHVVRGELGGIVDDGEIGPAVRAAPRRPDPLRLEEAAHVLADAAVGRRVQRADGLARVREDLPRGRLDRRGRPRALERASAVALIRGVVANVPGPVARGRLAPGGVRPRRDRLRAQRLDPPVIRHLAGERAAHVVVGRDVVHDAKVALI